MRIKKKLRANVSARVCAHTSTKITMTVYMTVHRCNSTTASVRAGITHIPVRSFLPLGAGAEMQLFRRTPLRGFAY